MSLRILDFSATLKLHRVFGFDFDLFKVLGGGERQPQFHLNSNSENFISAEAQHNEECAATDSRITTNDARNKLQWLYPSIKSLRFARHIQQIPMHSLNQALPDGMGWPVSN
jgi:hypothetical protein